MEHYVCRLEFLTPFDERKYYIGKHSGKIGDLGSSYFTSGKLKKIYKKNPKAIKSKIIGIFNTPEEALAFEGKIHNRLNVQDNNLFFNEQNQTITGKLDRTKRVTVINNETKEKCSISTDFYYKNNDKYTSVVKGLVVVKDSEGNTFNVTSEHFKNNENLHGVNKNLVHVKDKNGNKITITKDEYHNNKDKYETNLKGIYCKNKNGKTVNVSYEEFRNSDDLVSFNKGIKFDTVNCPICFSEISNTNIKRHIKTHKTRYFWVTDNKKYQTTKVKEEEYYSKMRETHYIEEKNGHYTIAYNKGEKLTIKKLTRIINENHKNR